MRMTRLITVGIAGLLITAATTGMGAESFTKLADRISSRLDNGSVRSNESFTKLADRISSNGNGTKSLIVGTGSLDQRLATLEQKLDRIIKALEGSKEVEDPSNSPKPANPHRRHDR